MKLYVLRHAQSMGNVKQLMDEDPEDNWPLSELGEEQAITVAKELKDVSFDTIYVSEFTRVQQTATYVNEYHHLQFTVDERLNEAKSGYQRQSFLSFKKAFREAEDKWNIRFGDGESFEDCKNRLHSFLEELKRQNDETVLVVTHGQPAMIIDGYFNNLTNDQMIEKSLPKNATYNIYEL